MRITFLLTKDSLKWAIDSFRQYGPLHPVLKEAALYQFWGAETLILEDAKAVYSIHQSKIGKRKKNKWEPYVNWYGAYTPPPFRGRGHATALYRALERVAVDLGCRRVKSLAGSAAGLGLHRSLGHQCWGRTEKGEVFVDSPLPGSEVHYSPGERPAQAPGPLMSGFQIEEAMKEGLLYDK